MGSSSARRRKARIARYKVENSITKHTTAAHAVDAQQQLAAARRAFVGRIERGGDHKTTASVDLPLPPDTPIDFGALSRALWVQDHWKGGGRGRLGKTTSMHFAALLAAHMGDSFPVRLVDTDTTGLGIASLVANWMTQATQTRDLARITEWLAQQHRRVLTAAQCAVLEGILNDPLMSPFADSAQPGDDDTALRLLDYLLTGPTLPGLSAVWPGADQTTSARVVRLLRLWEDHYGPIEVDKASTPASLPCQESLTFRRVAAILISWVIEVAGSDDPQQITACLPEFGLTLTADQQIMLATLVADTTLRVDPHATRTVAGSDTYLVLLSDLLAAPYRANGAT